MSTRNYFKEKIGDRGFTIVEMVVVITIFGIIAGLVLFRYRNYQAIIDLENTAQDIALEIQKAQNDAIGGRYPSLVNGGQTPPPVGWRPSYGVYFDPDPSHGHQKEFIFFFDRESLQPNDPNYKLPGIDGRAGLDDGSAFTACGATTSECLRKITITNDVSIVKTCDGDMPTCNALPTSYGLGNTSLVFTRPFPERIALKNALGIGSYTGSTFQISGDARIRVKSETTGNMKDIVITPLGQIRVETVQ